MLWRRRKAQRMDADVVAAASAAAATKRTPFDDDDPEMIEDPSYGTAAGLGGAAAGAGAYGASNQMMQQYYNNYGQSSEGYEPSHLSGGTAPGYAGMGAYGPMAAAGAGGAAAYYAGQAGTDGSHYYESVPAENAYGMGSMGHDNGYSQSAHDDPYGAGSGGHAGYSHTGAPQLNWAPGASPPLDHDVYGAQAAQGAAAGNVFADPSSSSNETDGRIDMTAHEAGSSVSLRDDQDYGRRLAVRND